MLVVFSGGGTGGHLYPGIAVARAISLAAPEARFEFWGAGRPLEAEILRKEGMTPRVLPSAPFKLSPAKLIRFAYAQAAGYFAARRLLTSEGVSAVVGLGGYSSYAPVRAACRAGLPTVLLEQNAVPGKANMELARRVTLVCLSWQASASHLPAGTRWELIGNPLRRGIVEASRGRGYAASGSILILGGSTGAVGLNSMVAAAAARLAALGRPVVHQTGRDDVERVRAAWSAAGASGVTVTPFIDDMPSAYKSAGLVICRAGGTTLSELALFGLPSILVPYPHHKDYHQMANARIFADADAAEIVEEGPSAGEALAARAEALVRDRARLERMNAACARMGRPEAADNAAERIVSLLKYGGGGRLNA